MVKGSIKDLDNKIVEEIKNDFSGNDPEQKEDGKENNDSSFDGSINSESHSIDD